MTIKIEPSGSIFYVKSEQWAYLYMSIFGCLDEFGHKIGFLESVPKSLNQAVYNYLNIKLSKITKKFFLQDFKNFLYFFSSK